MRCRNSWVEKLKGGMFHKDTGSLNWLVLDRIRSLNRREKYTTVCHGCLFSRFPFFAANDDLNFQIDGQLFQKDVCNSARFSLIFISPRAVSVLISPIIFLEEIVHFTGDLAQ